MLRLTRKTSTGWKSFIYENKESLRVGRPKYVRSAKLDEIRTANTIVPFEEQETPPSKHPGMKLPKEKRSEIVKKAKRDEDIGKPGKKFKEVVAKTAKEYGSKEAEQRVAAATMWRNIKADIDYEDLPDIIKNAIETSLEEIQNEEVKEKWTLDDFKDQVDDWKKAGFDDESKLKGMLDRAVSIAKTTEKKGSPKGKAERHEILGIMQRFFQKK